MASNPGYTDELFGQSGYSQSGENLSFVSEGEAEDDIALKVMRDITDATGLVTAQRNESKEPHRFYGGSQWDDIDRLRMEQSRRPALVLNEIQPTIDAVSGLERLNRMGVRYVTRALDSSYEEDLAGDLASEARDAADDLCGGANELSRAVKDVAIGGMGWVEIRCSFDEDIDGRVVKEYLPWDQMFWDHHNGDSENLARTTWRARVRSISRKMFRKLYGDKKLAAVDAAAPADWEERRVGKYELVTPFYSRANELANPGVSNAYQADKAIQVIQYQYIDYEPVYRYAESQQEGSDLAEMDEDSWDRLGKKYELLGMPTPDAVRQLRPTYKQAIVSRGVVLEEPITLPNYFSLLCITGKWDDDKKVWYGIARSMLDPQRMKNKSVSAALAFYITNAKGGVTFKTSAFVDPVYAKEQWSKPDAWLEVNDNANIETDIIQRQPSAFPGEIGQFIQIADESIRSTSGITPEIIGTAQGEVPSPTAAKRIQGGLAVLGWFFDSISRHMRTEARVELEFIREFWTRGQLIQVGGPANSRGIPLLRSSLPMDYELVIDESVKQNPNLKAQVWADLQPIIPSLLRFGFGRFLLTALKYSPLPAQLVAEIQREANQQAGQPGGGQQQKGRGKQDPPELLQAKVQKMSAERQKTLTQARAIDRDSNLKVAELALEGMQNAEKARHQRQIEQHKVVGDLVKAARMQIGGASNGGTPLP